MPRQFKLDHEKAAERLHALIRECDADTLAAIYENAFGAVKEVEARNPNHFKVTFCEGLEDDTLEEIL